MQVKATANDLLQQSFSAEFSFHPRSIQWLLPKVEPLPDFSPSGYIRYLSPAILLIQQPDVSTDQAERQRTPKKHCDPAHSRTTIAGRRQDQRIGHIRVASGSKSTFDSTPRKPDASRASTSEDRNAFARRRTTRGVSRPCWTLVVTCASRCGSSRSGPRSPCWRC